MSILSNEAALAIAAREALPSDVASITTQPHDNTTMEQQSPLRICGDAADVIRRIPEPDPVHIPDDGREAIDLPRVATTESRQENISNSGTTAHDCHDPVRKFWRNHVRLSLPHVDCRDHLGE